MIFSLDNYVDYNFEVVGQIDTVIENDYLTRHRSTLTEGIHMVRSQGEGWYGLKIRWENQRISEVLNLFRNMILDEEELAEFERSVIYKEGQNGQINEIKINYRDQPIKVKSSAQGDIEIEAVISCC